MRYAAVVLAILACAAGIVAAWQWYRASSVDSGWTWTDATDPDMKQVVLEGNLASQSLANERAARLNKLAAVWTAATVFLGTLGNLAGSFVTVCSN